MSELVIHALLNHIDRKDDSDCYPRRTDGRFSILKGQPKPNLFC